MIDFLLKGRTEKMLSLETGRVVEIVYINDKIQILSVEIEHKSIIEKAINYIDETGICSLMDMVVINSIGNRLKLGTGGYNLVYLNLTVNLKENEVPDRNHGHIIKMKYTPGQIRVKTVEENIEDRNIFDMEAKLTPRPVIFAILHSMLFPLVKTIKYINPNTNISCVYTYGGAMNANNSFILKRMKESGLINSIITAGECYGGDYESINIVTGILFGFNKLKSDIIVICCGPGVAGSSTFYGFSTFDFIGSIYSVKLLGLFPVLIPRISMADKRERHMGLSMQSISILQALDFPIDLPVYRDNEDISGFKLVYNQLNKYYLINKHNVHFINNEIIKKTMDSLDSDIKVMGRSYAEDPWFFNNCISAGYYSVELFKKLRNY